MLGKLANGLVESAAVHGTQIDLVVAAVQAEPAHPMLALWNLFLVVVTCICDGNLLYHFKPPFPCSQYILTTTIQRNDSQVKSRGRRVEACMAIRVILRSQGTGGSNG